jgi:hypothetical protein
MHKTASDQLMTWLEEQPLMQRCLLCGAPATGIGVVVPHAGVAVAYAGCEVHRGVERPMLLALLAALRAPDEINMADTDVSVH